MPPVNKNWGLFEHQLVRPGHGDQSTKERSVSMERRQFLIGAGSILTASFVSKAEMFLKNKNSVLPIIEKSEAKQTIYFIDNGFDFELRLNSIGFDFPHLTYREALEEYFGVWLPRDKPLKLSDYRELYYEHGITPKQLDEEADFDFYTDAWGRRDSPSAKAYQLLDGMDLFDYSTGKGRLIGGLNFIDGCHPGNDYLGVRADDAMSANLLQARLLELDENISVEIVGGAS